MTKYKDNIAVSTSIYNGYSLDVAFKHISELGFKKVEIAAIDGLLEHVTQDEMTGQKAFEVNSLLDKYNLANTAFSAHIMLADENAVEKFKPRMKFASLIGASIINTKAGPVSNFTTFKENMEKLIEYAEKLDIAIGLENNGDIISHGPSIVELINEFKTDRVLLNYDYGNVYTNSSGKIDPAKDFIDLSHHVGHIHFKDIMEKGDFFYHCAIGEGLIDFDSILKELKNIGMIPATIELPVMLKVTKEGQANLIDENFSLEYINNILNKSMNYIMRYLS